MCDTEGVISRVLLVISNASFLAPIIKLIQMSTVKDRHEGKSCCMKFFCSDSNANRHLIEIIMFGITMVVSSIYHLCDGMDKCGSTCIGDWKDLYYLDFIFSYHCITTILLYFVDHHLSLFKVLAHIIFLGGNTIYITQIKEMENPLYDNIYYVATIILCSVVIVSRIIYLKCKNNLKHEFTHHFDYVDFIVACVFVILGVIFKILGGVYEDKYYIFHSLWHIFIMLGIYLGVEIYDQEISLFCWKRKKTNCNCNDRDSNNDNIINPN
jgi:uncharacterized membrane protein YiaA